MTSDVKYYIEKSICERVKKNRNYIIFPMGKYGSYAYSLLKDKQNVFCADNGENSYLSLDDLLGKNDGNYTVILLVKNKSLEEELRQSILRYGDKIDEIITIDEAEKETFEIAVANKMIKSLVLDEEGVISLFCPYDIGDSIQLLCFSNSIKKFYDAKKLIVLGKKNQRGLETMFDGIDEWITVEKEDMELLKQYNLKYYVVYGNNYIFGNYGLFLKSNQVYNNMIDAYRLLLLQLPVEMEIQKVSEAFKDNMDWSSYSNAVVLAPYAHSLPMLDFSIWEGIAEVLKCKKYDVYTNVYGEEKEIRGTKRLELGFKDIFNLGYYCKGMITFRSGFSDLMAFNMDMKHIVIYPDMSEDYGAERFNPSIFGSKNIHSIEYDGKSNNLIDAVNIWF